MGVGLARDGDEGRIGKGRDGGEERMGEGFGFDQAGRKMG